MTIDINPQLIETAQRLADANSTTPELHLKGVVEAYLFSALKQKAVSDLGVLGIEDAKVFQEAIAVKVEETRPRHIPMAEVEIEKEVIA